MKRIIKTYFKLFIFLFGISMLLVNCERENNVDESLQDLTSSKLVNVNDIQEVMNFIKSKTNEDLQFVLKNNTGINELQRDYEEDVLVGTVLTDQIQQLTNSYGKSNYTFILEKPIEDIDKVYFMNLVVKEYNETLYAFIAKYVPTDNWMLTSFIDESSMTTFTGVVYVYNQEGIYAGKVDMTDGVSTRTTNANPCTGDGTSGPGDFPETEGGGSSCWWYTIAANIEDENPQVIYVCPETLNSLRTGDTCGGDGELGGGTNGSNENPNSSVLLDNSFMIIPAIRRINNCLDNSLTPEQLGWLDNSDNHESTLVLDNYISTNNCSSDAKIFGALAVEANMNNDEVDI